MGGSPTGKVKGLQSMTYGHKLCVWLLCFVARKKQGWLRSGAAMHKHGLQGKLALLLNGSGA